jgi:hypothetical protein
MEGRFVKKKSLFMRSSSSDRLTHFDCRKKDINDESRYAASSHRFEAALIASFRSSTSDVSMVFLINMLPSPLFPPFNDAFQFRNAAFSPFLDVVRPIPSLTSLPHNPLNCALQKKTLTVNHFFYMSKPAYESSKVLP